MKHILNNDFIKTVQETLPENVSLVNKLMEILDIGKEATYRRLRSEVPFSFQEVVVIAKELGISLDQIIGNYDNKSAVFNLSLINSNNAMSNYCDTLNRYINYLNHIKDDPLTSVSTVANSVPFALYSHYTYISKFRICRWLHQSEKIKLPGTLEEINVPPEVLKLQVKVCELLQQVANTTFIWDMDFFSSLVKEINYFYHLSLISEEDIEKIKEELYLLLQHTEEVASTGEYPTGQKVSIYLSNIPFEASYSYVEKGDFQFCLLRLYSVNSIDSFHPEVCKTQKEWIHSMKRYSTLITESGEMQRISFFNKQRKMVDSL